MEVKFYYCDKVYITAHMTAINFYLNDYGFTLVRNISLVTLASEER